MFNEGKLEDEKKLLKSAESVNSANHWLYGSPKNDDIAAIYNPKEKHLDVAERVSTIHTPDNYKSNRGSLKSNKGQNKNSRVQFDTYESSLEDSRDEKLVFKFI